MSSSGHIHLLEQLLDQKYSKELIYLLHIPTLCILAVFFCTRYRASFKEYVQNKTMVVKLVFFGMLIDAITALFFVFFAHYDPTTYFSVNSLLVVGFTCTAVLLYSLRWCKPSFTKVSNFAKATSDASADEPADRPSFAKAPADRPRTQSLSIYKAIILGVMQGCALLPGISRFATVYTTSCWLGFSPRYAFLLTWFVQAPLIGAAVAKTVFFSSLSAESALLCTPHACIVLCAATVVGYYALAASYALALNNRLWLCAYYMIIPALVAFFCINYYTQTLI